MLKCIEKKCVIGNDTICINLLDTRDSYVSNNAMGEIGNIFISNQGVFIYPNYESTAQTRNKKESILIETFKELFGVDEYNPLSPEYYSKIKEMIKNGELSSFGYLIEEDLDFDLLELPVSNEFDDTNWHNEYAGFENLDTPIRKSPRR